VTRRTRLRRTAILCLHFLRNLGFYRAWNAAPQTRRREQFWISLNANFIDMTVLEWCKLFGDRKAMHHWSKSVTDHVAFANGLRQRTGMTETGFEAYRLIVREYRDKFVAHLDELPTMQIPDLQPALESVRYLYTYLLENEDDGNVFPDAPRNPNAFYRKYLAEGKQAHAARSVP
jgi:hypothetical protein